MFNGFLLGGGVVVYVSGCTTLEQIPNTAISSTKQSQAESIYFQLGDVYKPHCNTVISLNVATVLRQVYKQRVTANASAESLDPLERLMVPSGDKGYRVNIQHKLTGGLFCGN